ncbi:tetratricopeptide repeat protein [Candidatus Uhrbacteria bacterium]|nr:tetratricopeptide repeat protein [Candidatus Uhrbacteria bacterium]
MEKKYVFGIALLILVLAGAGAALYVLPKMSSPDEQLQDYALLESLAAKTPESQEFFEKARNQDEEIRENPHNLDAYVAASLSWKALGSMTGEKAFYQHARAVIHQQIKRPGGENAGNYLNLGNLSRLLGEQDKAIRYYRKGIELAPGDEQAHIALANYYRELEKSPDEVIAVYKEGLRRVAQRNVSLILEMANYMTLVGRKQEARELYILLFEKDPSNPYFRAKIDELSK